MKTKSAVLLLACLLLLSAGCGKTNTPAIITVSPEDWSDDSDQTPGDEPDETKKPEGYDTDIVPGSPNTGDEALQEPEEKAFEPSITDNEIKEVLSSLLESGCGFYDIIYGEGLSVDLEAESTEDYWTYYPVTDARFSSIDAMKAEGLRLFTEEHCEYSLFDDMCGQFYSRYMEENGVLYSAPACNTGMRDIVWDISSSKYMFEIDGRVYVSLLCEYEQSDEGVLPGVIVLRNTENGWRLDCDVSVSNLPQEKCRAGEVSLQSAAEQFEKMSAEQTGLAKDPSDYKLLFDPEIVEVSGVRCYDAFLYTLEENRYKAAGDILLAMDGSGIKQRLPDEFFFVEYDAAVYHGYGDGCLAAVEYLGTFYDESFESVCERYSAQYLVTEAVTVDCTGADVFAIVPKYTGTTITVRSLDENNVPGDIIMRWQDAVMIICCNVSDIMPNTLVEISYNGQSVEFSPFISLKDGAVVTAQRISIIPKRFDDAEKPLYAMRKNP